MASLPSALRRAARACSIAALAALACAGPAAAQDAVAPSVAFTAPGPSGTVGAGVATPLTVAASGDLRLLTFTRDGGIPLCVFTRAHDAYACPWTPAASDVGTHEIQATLTDATGATVTASLPISVGRLAPQAVRASTTRRHLRSGGWSLSTRGSVTAPPALGAPACGGTAVVTVSARGRAVVDRSVAVTPDCRFASTVSFAAPRRATAVVVAVAFRGGALLAPRRAPAQTVRLGRE